MNWLQVSAPTKHPEVDEGEGDEFESKMMTLFGLKAQQQAFEFILPGKSAFHDEAEFVERGIKEALASPFEFLAVAGVLLDVRLQPRIEDALAISFAVKTGIQIEHGTAHRETRGTDDVLEGVQPRGHQHEVHLVDWRHRQGRQDIAMVVYQRAHFLPLLVFVTAGAKGLAPFLATVFEPSPWSRERSNFLAASRCWTEAMKARSSEPSSAQRANSLKTPV